ncbi:MAG TPA: hypothetical protein VL970_13050, partial [Candidatus Acidoferrales bacterium]|nr:hypothetical protein [Candidatus Acidoferrales bacterium]
MPRSASQRLGLALGLLLAASAGFAAAAADSPRERICLNEDWRFTRGDPTNCTASLLYDVREQRQIRRLAEAEADGNSWSNTIPAVP